ncbi:MAG TPA: alpha/beta hydrolase [Puia sp.]|jgi:acetyl esterase/lipase
MKKLSLLIFSLFPLLMATAQQELPLYGAGPIPNSKPAPDQEKVDSGSRPGYYTLSKVSHPTLTVFLPPQGKGNGTAVVVCPGGGYTHLAMAHEGMEVARLLNEMGIAAFVLKYRLPSDETMIDKTIGPLQDAQRAIQLVRQRAAEWAIKPGQVGIMGFSAGGHLASTAGTHFGKATIDNKNNISLRPDFMVLLYPVISFSDSTGHRGSRDALIGTNPKTNAQLVQEYSNELQVTPQTPPAFIVHAEDDKTVPVANSIHFYESLLHNKVPAELHVYPKGGHGFGLHNATTKDQWADRMKNWLQSNGWLM